MLTSTLTFAFHVSADTKEQFEAARAVAQRRSNLEFVDSEDLWQTYEDGVQEQYLRSKRVGDFFESVQISDSSTGDGFDIVFCLRKNADRYWRDVAARLISAIQHTGATATKVILS